MLRKEQAVFLSSDSKINCHVNFNPSLPLTSEISMSQTENSQ